MLARRLLVSLIFLLSCAPFSLGEAKIPAKDRVRNQQPGYCAWAALETVCRHQGIKAGYDLLEKRKLDPDLITWDGRIIRRSEGHDFSVAAKMQELGIAYQMNPTGAKTKEGLRLIVEATEAGHGAVVGLWHEPVSGQHHAVVVVDINSETFDYIDSNSPGVIWSGSVDWFLWSWDGFVMTVDK